jgi:hypothetical protein
VIVDNLDAETSSVGWWGASGASGFWATDSEYSFLAGSSFTFSPNIVPGTTYAVYAWWTAAPNRDTAAPYQISSGTTLLDTVNVNQQTNGGQWNQLGVYTFNDIPGVTVLANGGGVVSVADAVRFVPITTPVEVVVDNLDAETSTTGWWGASGASGFWATDSDYSFLAGSSFTFSPNLVPGATYAVYAWWTAAPNRDTAAPYQISSGATLLDTVNVNQQTNGGQWNQLGVYTFNDIAGVTVLANGGGVVSVADAVRFVPVTAPVEVVVDNLDAETSTTGWWGASGASGFWATDSEYSFLAGSSFTFSPNLVPGAAYTVYAWWTAAPNRDTAVPYQISSGATLLDTVNVNQRTNGGQWNQLGVYTFNDIPSITVLTNGGGVVTVADAVRFVPVP